MLPRRVANRVASRAVAVAEILRYTNGAAFCSEACEDGAWQILPTGDGEMY
jgi:hypothetical protein